MPEDRGIAGEGCACFKVHKAVAHQLGDFAVEILHEDNCRSQLRGEVASLRPLAMERRALACQISIYSLYLAVVVSVSKIVTSRTKTLPLVTLFNRPFVSS